MKILAIESSGAKASAAILDGEALIIEKTGPFKVTHSETLMPMISECFAEISLRPENIDLIAVSGGPGSFTGLRIGSATAKGLGFALGKDLVHVPTLDAMAVNFEGCDKIIIPMMDARRNQVYTGIYDFKGQDLNAHLAGCAMPASELIDLVNERFAGREVIFLGDGVPVCEEMIRTRCRVSFEFAQGEDALQRAKSVGILGSRLAGKGCIVSAADEAPEYLRPSQAERVRAEQSGNQLF